MKEYIEKLYTKLREAMEKPVTLGSAEEVGLYAKTIRKLEQLDCRAAEPKTEFDRETAIQWTANMQNADGTTGPHWSLAQTEAYAQGAGVTDKYDKWVWFATMNKEYSDGIKTAIKHGVNRPEYFIDRAIEFLDDKDGPGPERKLMEYYEHIARRGTNTK